MTRILYMAVLGLCLMGLTASADTVTLDLTPSSGTVSGLPGDTVGWGYTIDNETDDTLIVANSYFCEPGQDPLFTTCASTLGSYTDFIANNGTLIGPDSPASQDFGPNSGVGEYVINSSASGGQSDTGSIVVLYDLYDDNFDQVGGTMELSAPAEVDVTGAISPVPEPGLASLLALGFAALIACRAGAKRSDRAEGIAGR